MPSKILWKAASTILPFSMFEKNVNIINVFVSNQFSKNKFEEKKHSKIALQTKVTWTILISYAQVNKGISSVWHFSAVNK